MIPSAFQLFILGLFFKIVCIVSVWSVGHLAFAQFLQLAMISFAHFLLFQFCTFFLPQLGAISDK